MSRTRIGSPSLLPQVETLFIYARGLAALGIVLWLFFSPSDGPGRFPIQMLLVLFAVHLGIFFLAVNRRWAEHALEARQGLATAQDHERYAALCDAPSRVLDHRVTQIERGAPAR